MIQKSRKDFFSIIILLISLYSLAMSGLWLGIALRRPHWGHRISSHGIVKPNDASLVSTLLAKSIEVSFGATFVAFLGQELSHRAFFDPSRGISIAEMSMRAWVVQPGTMIAHWNRLRCGVSSSLGLATFFVAWFAMLYTSASDALGKISHRIPYACPRASRCPVLYVLRIGWWQTVSPRLLPGAVHHRQLYGNVSTSFANIEYIKRQCQTPLTSKIDAEDSQKSCDNVVQTGNGWAVFKNH